MKKLINLAGILSLFLLFSCSNLIENKNTSVRVVLPEAENVARTIGISYELADVAEYSIIFEGENFNNTYTCNPGDDLYIDEINAGEYKVTGYAKNKDGECIGYGITAAVVLPEQENEVEIVLKKNIVSNIATVIPSRTKQSLEIGSEVSINRSAITPDIKLEVTYLSGYKTTIGLEEILDTGFFFANTYLVYPDGKKEQTDRIDYKAKELIFEVCMYDCSFNDFIKAKENPELAKELLQKQKTLFEFSYSLELLNVIFPIYDDEDTTVCHKETYSIASDINIQNPAPRSGFEFAGWYYFNGDTEVEKLEDNKILISNISKYLDAEGCIKGKWKLVNLTAADLSKFNSANYPNGFTLKLDDTNFSKDAAGYSALNKNLYLKEYNNSDLLINLDMYECEIDFFAYQTNIDDEVIFEDVYFSNNVNLRSIKLPNVENFLLSPNTFENCLNLQEVYIPKNFGGSNSAFSGIYNDCKFIIEEGSTHVTNYCKGVKYDSMLFSIPSEPNNSILLYEDCRKVEDDVKDFPEGIVRLMNSYKDAVFSCVKIPKSLTNIDEAFVEAKISEFEINPDNSSYNTFDGEDGKYQMLLQKYGGSNSVLLYDCAVTNEDYERTIPDNVIAINQGVYKNSKLKKIIIPNTVANIYENAFFGFEGEIVLNNSYTLIDDLGQEAIYPLDEMNVMTTALKAGKKLWISN